MTQLSAGEYMPDFMFSTPFEKELFFSETVKKKEKTALLFLRYYGCPVCQLEMRNLAKMYTELTKGHAQILVVLQSDPKNEREAKGCPPSL